MKYARCPHGYAQDAFGSCPTCNYRSPGAQAGKRCRRRSVATDPYPECSCPENACSLDANTLDATFDVIRAAILMQCSGCIYDESGRIRASAGCALHGDATDALAELDTLEAALRQTEQLLAGAQDTVEAYRLEAILADRARRQAEQELAERKADFAALATRMDEIARAGDGETSAAETVLAVYMAACTEAAHGFSCDLVDEVRQAEQEVERLKRGNQERENQERETANAVEVEAGKGNLNLGAIEIRRDYDGAPDDVVAPWEVEGAVVVHVERMDDDAVWMEIRDDASGASSTFWFRALKGRKLAWTLTDYNDLTSTTGISDAAKEKNQVRETPQSGVEVEAQT